VYSSRQHDYQQSDRYNSKQTSATATTAVLGRPVQTRLRKSDKTGTITEYLAARAAYTSTVQRQIPGNLVPINAHRSADGFT
jgi:hypothetical protein